MNGTFRKTTVVLVLALTGSRVSILSLFGKGKIMNQLLFLVICFFVFSASFAGQRSETFDIATFQAPNGWQRQNKGGVIVFNTSNLMSYIKREYTFNADGTYRFISKAFDPFSTKLLFGTETGTYHVSGDTLTITPKTSVLEGWSKKNGSGDVWGIRLDSQNRKLETATYRFTHHYFSGIQTTSLILMANNTTVRDGPFSGGTAFDNAWIYSPPCRQCFIEMPR